MKCYKFALIIVLYLIFSRFTNFNVILAQSANKKTNEKETDKKELNKPIENKSTGTLNAKNQNNDSKKNITEIDGILRFRFEKQSDYVFWNYHDEDAEFVSSKAELGINHFFNKSNFIRINFQYAGIWGGQEHAETAFTTSDNQDPIIVDTVSGKIKSKDTNNENRSIYSQSKLDVREAFINTGISSHSFIVGRQKLAFGDQRLIGTYDWSNVGRSHDGLRYIWTWSGFNELNVFFIINKETLSNDLYNDSAINTFPGNDNYFAGIYDIARIIPKILNVEPYFLSNYTSRTDRFSKKFDKLITTGNTYRLLTTGARLTNKTEKNQIPSNVNLDTTLEFAYQFGTTDNEYKSGEFQTISAYAFAVALGYTFSLGYGFRFRPGGEFDYASGDDPFDKKSFGRFTNLFHSNHMYYGQADFISWQNMIGINGNITFFYKESSWIKVGFWSISKARPSDEWYSNMGGDFQQIMRVKDGKTGLFYEIDFTGSHKFEYIRFEAGYSILYARDIITPRDKISPLFAYFMCESVF
jgi:hypothetical protein